MGTHGLDEAQSFCEVFISGSMFLLSVADKCDEKWRRHETDIYGTSSQQAIISIAGMAFWCYFYYNRRLFCIVNVQKENDP